DARKPGFRRPERDLTAGLALRRLEDEAFDEVGATARLGVERRLGPHWRAGLGWLVEITRLEDVGGEDTVELTGAPAFARYDSSDDPLDPTEGARLRLAATPIYARIDQEAAPFLTLDATAARYWALDEARRFVLASRLRAAAIWADEIEDVPLNRRLYSGGGGSVRGFEERFVGPLDAAGDPDGGRSALEAALELRAPVYGDLGAALFVDAGSVSEAIAPDFAEGVQVGAGLGLRYRSPVGPIRVDLATPLNPRPEDDRFEIYFSIGQAF
ncbi:MAG: outer membrane protein assembly factor, partial [Pseudomonadota bacterium]